MRAWIKDFNLHIVKKYEDGRPKHWWDGDSAGQKPDNRLKSAIHSMYRVTLSHNVLINLFGDQTVTGAEEFKDYLTFEKYYNSPIHKVLNYFADRLQTIPLDPNDDDEKEHFTAAKLDSFGDSLRDAAEIAQDYPFRDIRELYQKGDVGGTNKLFTRVRRHMFQSRASLGWICIPFLAFVDPKRPLNQRPDWVSDDDLRDHIIGIPETPGNLGMIGVGSLTYLDFMFYAPQRTPSQQGQRSPDAIRFENALRFAKLKGLFDSEDVVDRRLRESGLVVSSKGGGNGWQCDVDSTGRKVGCKVGTPQQYCVNNGSPYC